MFQNTLLIYYILKYETKSLHGIQTIDYSPSIRNLFNFVSLGYMNNLMFN